MLDPWFRQAYPLKHLKKSIYWSLIERRVLRDAGAVLFTATEEARLATHTFTPCEINPAVVGYGVALADAARQVSSDVFFQAWPETQGRRLVLFLGRLHPKKGGDLLIEAFAKVLESQPLLQLVMAGPDDGSGTRASLQAQAARLGIAERVTFTGMLSGDLKWSALQAAEVFALPSHQENFGIAVVEALAMGVPVLISDKVNIWREIVADEAGMAEADTPDGTTKLLRRWLALDTEARLQMKFQAAGCYQRHFHMSAAAQRLVDTIAPHLCGGNTPAAT
jgi:glycosyltransferase involved in cell wall biosynthesis